MVLLQFSCSLYDYAVLNFGMPACGCFWRDAEVGGGEPSFGREVGTGASACGKPSIRLGQFQ